MRSVKGRYEGGVVVLEEPAPVDYDVEVVVEFPDEPTHSDTPTPDEEKIREAGRRFGWEHTRHIKDGYEGSIADEVIRQRRMD